MTNERDSANTTALPKMTREQMFTETLVIETLLDAAMAHFSAIDPLECIELIGMAQGRVHRLTTALDSVNAPEAMS